jgi:hypothetical protein
LAQKDDRSVTEPMACLGGDTVVWDFSVMLQKKLEKIREQ